MPFTPLAAAPAEVRTDLMYTGLFALAYFIGAELGYALSLGPSVGGTFWPPAGIALAVLLVAPRRVWPLLLAAGIIANFLSDQFHGQALQASVAFAIANLSEPLVGALLLQRFFTAQIRFTRLPEIIVLAGVVVLVSAPLAAAIGAIAAQWWTPDPPGFLPGWRTWWVGDAVGTLVLTPAAVRLMTGWRSAVSIRAFRWLEAFAFAVAVVSITQLVFSAPPTATAMPFLVFPVMLWGSLRFGPVGVGGALCLIVLLTALDTAAGQGPFAAPELSLGDRLIALQVYVGVMALSFHGLGVLWAERTRTAAALRTAHSGLAARYRRIVEQSPFGILAIQSDGRVEEANPAWRQLRGSAADVETIGESRSWEDPAIEPLVRRAFAGEVVELPERVLVVPADGGARERRARGFAYPVKDEAGEVAEVVLIERDITEEVEAQRHREQLLEAERFARIQAERASRLKEEFLATLSHELRSPLNAIVGWTHVLRQSAKGSGFMTAVATIERNALAQARLIDDLLDMSRIVAGKVGLTLSYDKPAEIVAAAADTVRPVAEAKGVSLSVHVGDAADVSVSCDAARLQQVVANLLDNGIKFTPAGGRVEARLAVSEQGVQLTVCDTGQGIPADFLPNVFERFRQADGSTTRRHGGLGLGLSIARHIVEMHGGSITAQSDGADCGATFTVTLPAAGRRSACEPATGDELHPPVLTGLRVLVVDDDPDARELLRRLLAEQCCEVTVADSAEQALAMLAAEGCEVMLTDIGMPGTDGYELLRRARAANEAQKAVAVTAFARPDDRERALAAGFDGHLAKPVNPVLLYRLLEKVAAAERSTARRAV